MNLVNFGLRGIIVFGGEVRPFNSSSYVTKQMQAGRHKNRRTDNKRSKWKPTDRLKDSERETKILSHSHTVTTGCEVKERHVTGREDTTTGNKGRRYKINYKTKGNHERKKNIATTGNLGSD